MQKLPYKFKFVFKDNQGTESRMMIEDWETGQLYWNCLAIDGFTKLVEEDKHHCFWG
ncbi:MAG TPA: hypothetical protein PKV73_13570 [Agriterribacter sp.]|nr:hypothetical protein [Agriterribacter sp.]